MVGQNGVEPNGEIARLKAILAVVKDVWNTFGLPTIILGILLLLWTGIMPSPLSEARIIVEQIKQSVDRHLDRDKEIIFYMRQVCVSSAKMAKTPVEECLWTE